MKNNNHKYLWGIVFVLFLAVVITASVYISTVKQMTPTENEDVIALVPENTEDTETAGESDSVNESEDASVTQIETPKSTLKNGANGTGTVGTDKRQVGTLDAEMTVEDENTAWSTMTKVNIFKKAYRGTKTAGTENELTVENAGDVDDMDLIAPGTENDYTFWVKNTGQVGLDYCVWFEEHNTDGYEIPLEIRVKCGNHYILGSKEAWEPIDTLESLEHEGHLSVKQYAQYTLEWRWPFERGEDVYDTYLGDTAVEKLLEQEIIIHTYGEGYDRPIYEMFTVTGVKTGDETSAWLWSVIAVLALAAVLRTLKKMKQCGKKEAEDRE